MTKLDALSTEERITNLEKQTNILIESVNQLIEITRKHTEILNYFAPGRLTIPQKAAKI